MADIFYSRSKVGGRLALSLYVFLHNASADPPPPPKIGCEFPKKKILALCTVMVWGGFECFDGSHDGYANQGCGNTMPDLSNLVPLHSGQVKNFYLLVLGQVQMYYTGVTNYRCTSCLRQAIKQTILQKPMNYILLN